MKVIVVGNGKVGKFLVEQLYAEGHDITVIDKKLESLEALNNSSDVLCINGDGIDIDVLESAGVKTADLVVAVTSSDELNIVCCMLSKKAGAKKVIGRIRSREYAKQKGFIKRDLNIDFIINPEAITAREISNQFKFIGDFEIDTFCKGLVELVSFKITDEDNKFVGLSLLQIYQKHNIRMLVCAIERGDEVFIPTGNSILERGDIIHVLASNKEISKIISILRKDDKRIKSVVIVGAGRLTYYLYQKLIKNNMDIKIIDKDLEVCESLAEVLPDATIIHGDATNQEILEEEDLLNTDAFISVTGNDETNIILSLFAKTQEIKKVITKVNRSNYKELIRNMGLTNVFSPYEEITSSILTYVRSIENTGQLAAESIHRIVSNKLDTLEFIVNENFAGKDIPLKNLDLKSCVLVAGVVRKGEFIIADGNLELKEKDRVLIIAVTQEIFTLEDILG